MKIKEISLPSRELDELRTFIDSLTKEDILIFLVNYQNTVKNGDDLESSVEKKFYKYLVDDFDQLLIELKLMYYSPDEYREEVKRLYAEGCCPVGEYWEDTEYDLNSMECSEQMCEYVKSKLHFYCDKVMDNDKAVKKQKLENTIDSTTKVIEETPKKLQKNKENLISSISELNKLNGMEPKWFLGVEGLEYIDTAEVCDEDLLYKGKVFCSSDLKQQLIDNYGMDIPPTALDEPFDIDHDLVLNTVEDMISKL